jgi:succinate dehydrogenase/fumarate reductase flavoprotein subunit
MRYEELIYNSIPKWPYTVNYAKTTEMTTDVLVLGPGIAGGRAGVAAAQQGAKVIVVDKGAVMTSGCGGSGVDHWQMGITNPCSKFTPEEMIDMLMDLNDGSRNIINHYIICKESYDTLLEAEKWGMKIRDSEDVFKGAPFRDEKTKFCFAYDYIARYTFRVWGHNHKSLIYDQLKKLGATMLERTFVTSLLTEGGKQGAPVVGATAFNTHTGEFYVINAKATVLAMAFCQREHVFNTELRGITVNHRPGNMTGDGHAIAYRAGALVVDANSFEGTTNAGFAFPQYGYGNSANTYYAASIVDNTGAAIQWKDYQGNVLPNLESRYLPAPGQKLFIAGGGCGTPLQGKALYAEHRPDYSDPKLKRPFWTDMVSMPEYERRCIWGLMVAQEGRTLIPIYYNYGQAGFDPAKDMLLVYEGSTAPSQWLTMLGGGLYVDWNLQTSLPRLYAAGLQSFKNGAHAEAATTGRYAGRHAGKFALKSKLLPVDRKQVELEKARVYAPLLVKLSSGMEWKEFNSGVCKIMQNFCHPETAQASPQGAPQQRRTQAPNPELLKIGLKWFDELLEAEATTVMARNPRELMRVHEVFNILTNGQMIMNSCLAPTKEKTWVTIKLDGGNVKTGLLPFDFAGDHISNYKEHA